MPMPATTRVAYRKINQWPPAGVAAVSPLPTRYTPSVIMNRFRRPSLSDRWPKTSAPMTSPIRYQVAMSATAPADMFSVLLSVRSGPTLLAIVISRPSRIHATPSAITSRVWNRDHGSRSIRAGMRLRSPSPLAVSGVAAITLSFVRVNGRLSPRQPDYLRNGRRNQVSAESRVERGGPRLQNRVGDLRGDRPRPP